MRQNISNSAYLRMLSLLDVVLLTEVRYIRHIAGPTLLAWLVMIFNGPHVVLRVTAIFLMTRQTA